MIRLVNNYRHNQVALTHPTTADPIRVAYAHYHVQFGRQPYSIGGKREARFAIYECSAGGPHWYQQKTYRVFNVLLMRRLGSIMSRLIPHQEIVWRIIIGQHRALAPGL